MSNLITESDWAAIDGEICQITKFTPLAKIIGGKIIDKSLSKPYALVTLQCPRLPRDTVGGITHKLDFMHLWAVCVEGQLTTAEEVHIAWTKSSLKMPAKLFSRFMPGLAVMICKAGAYELITDPQCQPDLTGEARFKAQMPITQIIPDVLK
ncbi:MAG: hypothetical protein GW808_07295 [Sphingomonadales bacterium]|nr:hypothetical protein [Sphingomonadales bacterium]NCO47864.1 hypothetical protein [Sphingomonadales bacterium]NCO98985.1 hypothetical protein [Sphingomonadales bacterium]NCP27656.1 hypothetical protein [Sphingomonadales bacterium]NCP42186.1 hypothetical protein [Sphingomonadales bacterium]